MLLGKGHLTRNSKSQCSNPQLTKDKAQALHHYDKSHPNLISSAVIFILIHVAHFWCSFVFKYAGIFISLVLLEVPCITLWTMYSAIYKLFHFIFLIAFVYLKILYRDFEFFFFNYWHLGSIVTLLWKPVSKVVPTFQLTQWLFLDTLRSTHFKEIAQHLTSAGDA